MSLKKETGKKLFTFGCLVNFNPRSSNLKRSNIKQTLAPFHLLFTCFNFYFVLKTVFTFSANNAQEITIGRTKENGSLNN